MDRENLVSVGFHSYEGYRHHEQYNKAKSVPAKRIEGVADLGFVERFNKMIEQVTPLLKPQGSYDRDWYITPEVPLTGMVEDQEFTVFLSIQVQNPGSIHEYLSSYIRTEGNRPEGMSGMNASRNFCEIWEKSERSNEPLPELDHVEEIVEVYFRALADLTPKQLLELGFPSDYVPEPMQLTFEDAIQA